MGKINEATNDIACNNFTSILKQCNRKFQIISSSWTDNTCYEIRFRTEINPKSDDFNAACDECVDTFSAVTDTIWAKKISNTGPKVKFRKQYQCWTHGGKKIQKELLFDARKCKATLDIKILTENSNGKTKNKFSKLGLNTVVKINFIHLHEVDINKHNAFFVHKCKEHDVPKQPPPVNDRLQQLVAEMVQKGLKSSPKVLNIHPLPENQEKSVNNVEKNDDKVVINSEMNTDHVNSPETSPKNFQPLENVQFDNIQYTNNIQTFHLLSNVPLQTMDGIKIELPPSLQQYTQVFLSSSNLDMTESLLMCQPLLFDGSSQAVSIGNQNINPQVIQLNACNFSNQTPEQFL